MLRSKSRENAPGVIDSRSNLLPSLAGAQVLRDVLGRSPLPWLRPGTSKSASPRPVSRPLGSLFDVLS